jgi:endoglycosylceramidase
VAALICALALPGTAAAASALGHAGRWITDPDGRVVMLHGLNMVSKLPPFLPSAEGFGADDARFLARNGFNTVRLGVIYRALEPSPGHYDTHYLSRLVRTQRILARQGIQTLIDFHQDLYNERFSGEGWPDWAVQDDGLPAAPDLGFPANYFGMLSLSRAFDHFWANDPGPGGVGLQDRYAAAYARVARAFKGRDGVLGYDLMNEPWPGSVWPTCASTIGCPLFDRGALTDFHRRVIQAVRRADSRHLVWYEPPVTFNFGADTSQKSLDPRAGFSFHNYCLADAINGLVPPGNPVTGLACSAMENLVMDNADHHAGVTGDALLLSEFGATDDLKALGRVVTEADDHMVSWQEWHYCDCRDPTTSGPGVQSLVVDPEKAPRGRNVKHAKLETLARPYPQAVAGTPRRYGFDPGSRRFRMDYSTASAGGGGLRRGLPTEIFLPRVQYPQGHYRVEVNGARVRSATHARRLVLRACAGTTDVSLSVSPGHGAREGGCHR